MNRTVGLLPNKVEDLEATVALCHRRISLLEQDRERIKRDLHDGILQTLYSVGLGMAAAKLLMTPDQSGATAQANLAGAHLDRAIFEIREFLNRDLGAHDEETEPLETRMRALVESALRMTSVTCEVDIDPHAIAFIPKASRGQILYILREAISNCIRHAQADSILVSLTIQQGGVIALVIEDNGTGFTYQDPVKHRHGLKNLKARANQIGGQLCLSSIPGRGTRLVLTLDRSLACLQRVEGAFTH
ncbi:MAG: ATP-binding protein [Nitrospirales bacterium]|nr:ATP-binding protein [Nitrospirales bacterium]